jgi:hypothetical protein
MEAVVTAVVVFAEPEEDASCRLLGEGKRSRVRKLVGRSRNRSFLLVAFEGIVFDLVRDLGVLGLVLGEVVEVCCIVGRGLAVVLGYAVGGQRSSLKVEWGCFSGFQELDMTL